MLMFAPPRYELIEHSDRFVAYSGGSESNVAIGLERLGVHAAWIGKLPDNALGRKVVNGIRAYGVDTSACIWTSQGRVGTFFVEWGSHPRPVKTIYDRAGSAATTMTAEELDWHYVWQAEWLHMTGITPALSDVCRESTHQIVVRAREHGCRVSFDVNYRSLLWCPEKACSAYKEILPHVDILIATQSDAAMLAGGAAPPEALAEHLLHTYRPEAVVLTCGARGSLGCDQDRVYRAGGHDVQTVNRLGAGDAFDAGFLYGYLTSGLADGLRYGSAMAALKMTIPQNTPLISRDDVERLLSGQNLDVLR
jgi:2-dehydro-3-deoxygluconokinase